MKYKKSVMTDATIEEKVTKLLPEDKDRILLFIEYIQKASKAEMMRFTELKKDKHFDPRKFIDSLVSSKEVAI